MTLTDEQLQAWRKVAEAAGPHETWLFGKSQEVDPDEVVSSFRETYDKNPPGPIHIVHVPQADGEGLYVAITGNGPTSQANAKHIAWCSPQNIRALLTDLEHTRDERDTAKRVLGDRDAEHARLREEVARLQRERDEALAWRDTSDAALAVALRDGASAAERASMLADIRTHIDRANAWYADLDAVAASLGVETDRGRILACIERVRALLGGKDKAWAKVVDAATTERDAARTSLAAALTALDDAATLLASEGYEDQANALRAQGGVHVIGNAGPSPLAAALAERDALAVRVEAGRGEPATPLLNEKERRSLEWWRDYMLKQASVSWLPDLELAGHALDRLLKASS